MNEGDRCQAVVLERGGGSHRCKRRGVDHHVGFYACKPWVCNQHYQRLEDGWAHTFEGNAEWDRYLSDTAPGEGSAP